MGKLMHLLQLLALVGVSRATNCGLPGLAVGGLIKSSSDWSDGVNFSPGTQVRYSCTGDGQKMFGENQRECAADGQWTGSPPLCLTNVVLTKPVIVEIHSSHSKRPVIYDIPELTDGVVNFTENSPCLYVSSNELHVFNFYELEDYVVDQLWIHTNKPFSLNNDWDLKIPQNWSYKVTTKTSSPSIVVTNDDMQMTDELSVGIVSDKTLEVCELELYAHRIEHGCGRPDSLANGRVSVETNVATYSCSVGYQIDGPTQRTCTGIQWTEKAPICVPKEPAEPTVQVVTDGARDSPANEHFPDSTVLKKVSIDTLYTTPVNKTSLQESSDEKNTSYTLLLSFLIVLLILLLIGLGFCTCFAYKLMKRPNHIYEEVPKA